jgi:signal transduction histidine kinase
MAREVHDVVGHSLAVISMQAGVALHVLERRPERAAESLRAVRETSAQALAELRATLSAREPLPGLDRVPDLIAAVRAGGLPVTLTVRGDPTPVPAAVDLAAYRVIQESLTNVVRHAGPCRATVRVDYHPNRVTVTVADNGRGAPPGVGGREGAVVVGGGRGVAGSAGRGLAGLRERAEGVGGTLVAGPGVVGGFEVCAVLPTVERSGPAWRARAAG